MITKEHVEQLRTALEAARVEPGYHVDNVVVVPGSLASAWMQIADEAMQAIEKQLEDRGELLMLRARVAELEGQLERARETRAVDAVIDAEVEETLYDAVEARVALSRISSSAAAILQRGAAVKMCIDCLRSGANVPLTKPVRDSAPVIVGWRHSKCPEPRRIFVAIKLRTCTRCWHEECTHCHEACDVVGCPCDGCVYDTPRDVVGFAAVDAAMSADEMSGCARVKNGVLIFSDDDDPTEEELEVLR